MSVVLHPNQEAAAVGIGKRAQGAGNLLAVAHFKLKVLLLMLALLYQRFQGMLLFHFRFTLRAQK